MAPYLQSRLGLLIDRIGDFWMSEIERYTKLVIFLKRKPGSTIEEFQRYYETKHSKLIRLLPRVKRYFRRYLRPLSEHPMNTDDGSAYDVLTELWFDSREDLDLAMSYCSHPDVYDTLAEDETKFLDRSKTRLFVVDEHHSDLTVDRPAIG
jgi:uncharacterized protein (TIGR02118 family)